MGHFSCDAAAPSKSTFGGGHSLPTPTAPSWTWCTSSPNSSPPCSPPSHPTTAWRRRSSSSSSEPWATSKNWRTNTPPLPTRILPRYEDVELGDVLLLPPQLPPPNSIIFEKLAGSADQRPWGHPAVITGKFVEAGKECVRIRLCTTFGGRKIEDVKQIHQRKMYVLTDNQYDAKPHKGTRLVKMADSSGKFQKRSYVNLSWNAEYPIEFEHLTRWTGRMPLKFDAESTQRIVNCVSS